MRIETREASPGGTRRIVAPLIGAAILVGFAVASLSWKEGLFRRPRTPFDRSRTRSAVAWYILLERAAAVIPPGASVAVRHDPVNAYRDTYFARYARALLPGRQVLPTAVWGLAVDPAAWSRAQYQVIVGPRPAIPPGELVLQTPEGTVWRWSKP